jgi:hypothetical protein
MHNKYRKLGINKKGLFSKICFAELGFRQITQTTVWRLGSQNRRL